MVPSLVSPVDFWLLEGSCLVLILWHSKDKCDWPVWSMATALQRVQRLPVGAVPRSLSTRVLHPTTSGMRASLSSSLLRLCDFSEARCSLPCIASQCPNSKQKQTNTQVKAVRKNAYLGSQ